jgi:TRAP-type C4-dicarboxylate transport system permease small subunit
MTEEPHKDYLRSPRIWIYVVTIVGGLIWGIYFIQHAIHAAAR